MDRDSAERAVPTWSGGPSVHVSLDRNSRAPARARAALRALSTRAGIAEDEADTLVLLVSELVSNAVLHSDASPQAAIEVRAWCVNDRTVRVEVTDEGSGFAVPEPLRDPVRVRADGGYGLLLVDRQASRWGVECEDSTRVWFELDRDDDPSIAP